MTDWLVWQLVDSAFPSGGFAHSGGVEAAWRWGGLAGAARLEEFLRAALIQLAAQQLPFTTAGNLDPERIGELDQLCQAVLSNHVANRASRNQGQALVASACHAFGDPSIEALRDRLRARQLHGHLAPLLGFVTAALGMDAQRAGRIFLFIGLRGMISSAVRLNAIGPLEGQAIQFRLGPFAEDVLDRNRGRTVEEACQTAPLLDVLQGMHDRLYSRLFQS